MITSIHLYYRIEVSHSFGEAVIEISSEQFLRNTPIDRFYVKEKLEGVEFQSDNGPVQVLKQVDVLEITGPIVSFG